MASSFGGVVKLTGENEYSKALRNINSNLRAVSSELKLATTEFQNNGNRLGDLRTKNDALNKKLQQEQTIVKTCEQAIKSFTSEQTKNKSEIDKLKSSLNTEQQALEKMKSSTTASTSEISKQEQAVNSLKSELSKAQNTYDANNKKINEYVVKMNNAKTECSNLSSEINKTNDVLSKHKNQFNDGSQKLKEFSEESKKAGNNSLTLADLIKGNLLSDAIKKGFSTLVSSVKAVGSAFLNVGKASLESYADYEQLKGGVETLFKDSAGTVENYANNAYKTAGLSANEYMETVTSFSASLLQSLDGDTEKSAKVADTAITDMADNANKMGTSMESIQNAYQGFAKQNYTMLDNLKLGYGGTKSEMERLLSDAEKISGVKYDISNLNDVYNAIHVIQKKMEISGYSTDELSKKLKNASLSSSELKKVAEDMGISYEEATNRMKSGTLSVKDANVLLGTTAKEATETIQGSVASMKSAWGNLLTGIADEDADFNTLATNFVDSVVIAGENVLPRVSEIFEGIGLLITDLLPILVEKVIPMGTELITNLVTGLQDAMPDLLGSLGAVVDKILSGINQILPQMINIGFQIISQLVSSLLENLPQILQMGIQMIVSLTEGIAEQLPELVPQIIDAVVMIVETLLDNIDLLIDAGIDLIMGLADGLIEALPNLIDKIPEIIDKLVIAITNYGPKMMAAGIELTIKLAVGIVKAIPNLLAAVPKIFASLFKGIGNYYGQLFTKGKELLGKIKDGIVSGISKIKDVGKDLITGLWSGVTEKWNSMKDKVKDFGKGVVDKFKNVFGIHSPSKIFKEQIGKNLALGIGDGFTLEMKKVNSQILNAMPKTSDLQKSISAEVSLNSNTNSNNDVSTGATNFTAIINNNSKYTTPAENVRLFRKEMKLYNLKYGKGGA